MDAWYNYMPFVGLMSSAVSRDVAYRYTGQEYDGESGLHNFRARLYDAELGRFYARDPLFALSPERSPYHYARNNPVMRIDPTGAKDVYTVDARGHIDMVKDTDDDFDVLQATDQEGNVRSIKVDKEILNNNKQDVYVTKEGKEINYDYMAVKNDQRATELFEFVSENTNVEWSQVKYGDTENYISTSHLEASEVGISSLVARLLVNSPNTPIREHIHSHLTNSKPSGFDPRSDPLSGDKYVASQIEPYSPRTKFKIYFVPDKRYIEYNSQRVKAP